ncbi:MAG TPA: sigma-E processing peptidase SpoIIGA [Clostridiales bacterium]|nr:sigma-E processing peptidase SpoIIGA [Clostridiales bacterium]
MPVIYLDVLLALNLFIDFLLLSAVVRILRLPCKRFRLVLGAVAGSIFSAALFLPPLPAAVSMLIKIASACVIVKIAFKWQSPILYIKQVAVFLISSALFGGLAFAIWFFAAPSGFYVVNGVVYYNVSPLMLTVLTVASYLIISLYDRLTHKRMALGQEYTLTIDCGCGPLELRALYDTGHHVTDVFSGKPVAVVRFGAIERNLPENLRESVLPLLDFGKASQKGENYATAAGTRLRMIPLKTVSGTGLLPAFCPAQMVLSSSSGKSADITGCFIAVCQILGRGEYDAIIGTDMITLLEGSSIKCSRQYQN